MNKHMQIKTMIIGVGWLVMVIDMSNGDVPFFEIAGIVMGFITLVILYYLWIKSPQEEEK